MITSPHDPLYIIRLKRNGTKIIQFLARSYQGVDQKTFRMEIKLRDREVLYLPFQG